MTTKIEYGTKAAADAVREIDANKQRDLSGDRRPQSRLAGGEQGEQGQGETVETTNENPGGIMADKRDRDDRPDPNETEQHIPGDIGVMNRLHGLD